MSDSYFDKFNKQKEIEILKAKQYNKYTSKYGLILTDTTINNIIERRREVLKDTGRIEFNGGSVIEKIIKEFCDSPYIIQENYAETLYELIEIFYTYKNETMDLVSDDELISFMRDSFNGICQGDLEYLSGTVLYKMRDNVLNGKPIDYNEKEEEDFE